MVLDAGGLTASKPIRTLTGARKNQTCRRKLRWLKGEKTHVRIGRGTMIREFVTIHRGTEFGGGLTRVGEEGYIMAYCHIAHDCIVGNHATFANGATLGGHIEIGNHVYLSYIH